MSFGHYLELHVVFVEVRGVRGARRRRLRPVVGLLRVERVHDDLLGALDLGPAERTPLSVRILKKKIIPSTKPMTSL